MSIIRHLLCFVLFTGGSLMGGADAPAPEISHALLGVADEVVEQGEPLRIVVRLNAPRESTGIISLAPANGAWSDAIAVEIVPAGGGAVMMRADPLGKPVSPVAKLDAGHVAGGLWRISAEAMQRLAPADYVVRARLAIRSGAGWIGEVVSDEIPLRIVAASDSADRASQRAVNRAQDALLGDRLEAAALVLDARLAQVPDDVAVLTVRAEVALRANNPMAAMICLNRASPMSGSGQPDIEREELLTRVMSAMHAGPTPSVEPPKWSWPPAAVMEPTPEPRALFEKTLVEGAATKTGPMTPPVLPSVVPAATPSMPVVASAKPLVVAPPARATQPATTPAPANVLMPASSMVVPTKELIDAKIIADPTGQWAASAIASSQYGAPRYSAAQATGAPNIALGMAGDNPDAWCPAEKNDGTAWLELTFAKPVYATEIRVRQNNAPGAIAKIETVEPDGAVHVWWQGVDPFVAPGVREIAWFAVRVPQTSYSVAKVKITLNLATVPGWKQFDAVQLVGVAQ